MCFDSETDFEQHIRNLVAEKVVPNVPGLELLGSKRGVDLCLLRNGPASAIFFLEVKYFNLAKNHSMVALGSGTGGGFQPEVLAQRPDYLETHLRWVLGTAKDDLYYLLSTAEAVQHLSGEGIGDKQNGFNRSVFKKSCGLSETDFVSEVVRWVRSA